MEESAVQDPGKNESLLNKGTDSILQNLACGLKGTAVKDKGLASQ